MSISTACSSVQSGRPQQAASRSYFDCLFVLKLIFDRIIQPCL